MKFSLPQNIVSVISIIINNGFSAHLVGGCIRDIVLGKEPQDWDITTNAAPEEIKKIFYKTRDTGLRHGTVTVYYKGTEVQITTWRRESHYSDHRRPDHIYLADSLKADLSRRDFTMNALAYNPNEGIIDPFNGLKDITSRLIRCVGNPEERFCEDALRMLRAIRFAAQLGFDIENETFKAIQLHYRYLEYISPERVQSELNKILKSDNPQKLALLWETGINRVIFPEITALNPLWFKITENLSGFLDHSGYTLIRKKIIFLTLLFYTSLENSETNHVFEILKRCRYDNKTIKEVIRRLECIRDFGVFSYRNILRMLTEYGKQTAFDSMLILSLVNKNPAADSLIKDGDKAFALKDLNLELLKLSEPVKLAIKGSDLTKAGLCKGKQVGLVLKILGMCIYEKPFLNEAEILSILAKEILMLVK